MKVVNPIIQADMPDPDLLRVKDTYYMVSTTMFYTPGAPILKSKDLCHWEIVSYIYDILEDNESYRLEHGKHAYGKGQWATSLTCRDGRYYACFTSHDCGKTYIFSADDIEADHWERVEIDKVFHDMSFLFWQDVPYLVYGNGDIRIVELNRDMSGIRENGLNKLLLHTPSEGMILRCEGCRAFVRSGYIYLLFIDWPQGSGRREVCYRSRSLDGPYEFRVLMDDSCGYPGHGIAQGTLIDSENGEWYAMLFQDRGASGRIPFLMPAHWEEDWPVLGVRRTQQFDTGIFPWCIPESFETPFTACHAAPVVISDSFSHESNQLALPWQWNHNPSPSCWSFTERPGYLRLMNGHIASGLTEARNTLTQRTLEPGCICEVTLDASGMDEGDYAGLCALQGRYGQIGVKIAEGRRYFLTTCIDKNGTPSTAEISLEKSVVSLKIVFDYRNHVDRAVFCYRDEKNEWVQLGAPLDMVFTLDMFVGYRIGLFSYAGKQTGGYADFRDFVISSL